jgi:DNA mismatch repair protein MutL
LRATSFFAMQPNIIQLLPEHIANQIAAGEVVQRPSSVVKELLENSLDAGATAITLTVKEAGKNLITVTDNGKGMYPTDAIMCFARHATSKLKIADDLFNLNTFGFRGEAMASIAAVAQVDMRTRPTSEELGTHVYVEGNEIVTNEPSVAEPGTTISVKNLFYNVPARRNFLKSNPVEMRHVLEEFQRVALAHPDKAFKLKQADLDTLDLRPGKLSQRIVDIFGASYKEQLATCQEDTDLLKIKGYVGKPEYARKGRGEQYFFVNNRYIRSAYLQHAVIAAFDTMLAPETKPFFVLFLEIDPRKIDINVHPTKTEIKFEDEHSIYAIIKAAVRRTLSVHNFTPTLDFERSFSLMGNSMPMVNPNVLQGGESYVSREHAGSFGSTGKSARERNNLKNWETLYNPGSFQPGSKLEKAFPPILPEATEKSSSNKHITVGSLINDHHFGVTQRHPDEKNIIQVHNRYMLSGVKSGLLVVDLQSALERILYERYMARLHTGHGESQQVLFPKELQLNPIAFSLAIALKPEFGNFGFRYTEQNANTLVFNGVPADLAGFDERELFEQVLYQTHSPKFSQKGSRQIHEAQNTGRTYGPFGPAICLPNAQVHPRWNTYPQYNIVTGTG